MDNKKRLTYIADQLLKLKDQEDALRDIGKRNPEQASAIENIFAAFENLDMITEIDKLMSVISLIKNNIKNAKGYNNFSESEYSDDKNKIFNIKSIITSTNQITKNQKQTVNKIYKKHLNIQKILEGK